MRDTVTERCGTRLHRSAQLTCASSSSGAWRLHTLRSGRWGVRADWPDESRGGL